MKKLLALEEQLKKKLLRLNLNKFAIAMSLPVFFLLINAHMTTYFSLAIDNELALTRESPNTWLLEGRWGATLLEGAFGTGMVPWVSYSIFAILFSVSFLIWSLTIRRKIDWKVPLAFIVSSTFPGLWLLLIFRANVIPAGFAYLFSTVSLFAVARLYQKQNSKSAKFIILLVSTLSLSFAISIYQAFFTVFLLGVFAVGIFSKIQNRDLIWFWVRSLAVLVSSLMVFQIVNELLQAVMGFERGGYIGQFWRPVEIWSNLIEHLMGSLVLISETVLVSASAFGVGAELVVALIATAILSSFVQGGMKVRLTSTVSAAGLLIAPFAIALLASGPDNSPLRSLVALPLFFAAVTYLALDSKLLIFKVWAAGLVVLISLQFLSITGTYSAVDRLRNEFDAALASQIFGKLDSGCNQESPDLYVAFSGNRHFKATLPTARGSTFGSSIFSWDNLSNYPWRVNALMNARGYYDFSAVQLSELTLPEGLVAGMATFPSATSVTCVDGIHIVKLSEVN